ncbi:hypothetical protein [Nakamurella aerolata]|uniref:Uncharacterized protein n=1 Tax=Nakamurella aerolata TaxID=1656892 RepID=A0A849ADE1_9ACTN|nr:hypothetical protein [Nakamurella aerolata]NNG34892.1 hypothetical protein [Nakamurella aerolata]
MIGFVSAEMSLRTALRREIARRNSAAVACGTGRRNSITVNSAPPASERCATSAGTWRVPAALLYSNAV